VGHTRLVTQGEAQAFVDEWVAAWNAHDLERILGHFAEDVTFTSPLAAQRIPPSGGVIRGKAALREYWGEGLRLIPDLRFDVEGVYLGVDALVINYRNQKGTLVNEVLVFEGALVAHGYGTYLGDSPDPAGWSVSD